MMTKSSLWDHRSSRPKLAKRTQKTLVATKRDFLKMIRLFCSECVGGPRAAEGVWPIQNIKDVADCTAPGCVWFKYRFGTDPDKNPKRVALARKHLVKSTQNARKMS
jgi:hypothetical protein